MAIEGRLGAGGAADLLGAVWGQERTGILDVEGGGVERRLLLQGGDVVYVSSSDNAEKLPLWLLARKVVDRDALVAATKAGPDMRQSLAASGALSAEAHDRELGALVAEVVTRMFALTDGRFSLVDKPELAIAGTLASNPMVPILWRAARSCPAEFASGFLGDKAQRVMRTKGDEALGEIPDMTPQEGYLLSRIDGYSSVQDIVGMSPLPVEATHRFLVGLTCVGLIDVQGRPAVKLPRPGKGSARSSRPKPAAASAAAKPADTAPQAAQAAATTAARQAAAPSLPEGIDAVRDLLAKTADANYYGVLAIKQTAEAAEIRKAYYSLARNYHPDRFAKDLPDADRQLVEEFFSRISEAWATLSDDARRAEYDERLKSGALAAEKQDKKPVDARQLAKESFDKSRALLAAGDRGRALGFLEHAVDTDKDNWDYRMALGRFFLADARLRRRAEAQFLEAIRIDQTKADAYWQLGLLYKTAGVKSRALQQFREGLKWDASHGGILKELADMGEKR